MSSALPCLAQEVEVRQALLDGEHSSPPGVLPHIASPGDLLLQDKEGVSVLVQQPTYQVRGVTAAASVGHQEHRAEGLLLIRQGPCVGNGLSVRDLQMASLVIARR